MADLMRFGHAERFLLAMWLMLATALIVAVLNTAIQQPEPGLVTVVQWWARIGVATAMLIIAMPALRYLYRELVAPRLPANPINL